MLAVDAVRWLLAVGLDAVRRLLHRFEKNRWREFENDMTAPPVCTFHKKQRGMEGDLQTASASLSSFSPSSSSSTAMVDVEQPSLPPGTITTTTTASASSSPSATSSSPSTAMVVHEQPSLPPGPIKKTMTKQDVVTNLIAFDKSQSDG